PDGKIKPKPAEFFIDMDVCMNCGYCAEFCPFDAIKMDHNFEMSNYERDKTHVFNLQDLLVSTEYYGKTHPVAYAEEEDKRRKKPLPPADTHRNPPLPALRKVASHRFHHRLGLPPVASRQSHPRPGLLLVASRQCHPRPGRLPVPSRRCHRRLGPSPRPATR